MNLVGVPAGALLAVALALSVSAAVLGQRAVHARFPAHDFVQHNEVGGFIVAVAGTIYAVLLGFLTVVAWQHFADARQLVALESAADADAWHTALGLPEVVRTRVRRELLDYADTMVAREWPAMRTGGFDARSDLVLMDALEAAGTFVPANAGQATAQSLTLAQLTTLHDLRQRRLAENVSAVLWFEWLVLGIGAAVVVAFCWLFGLENATVHAIMTGFATTIVVSALVLLFELQYPFRTALRIGPEDWLGTIGHIHAMQTGAARAMRM